MIKKKKGIKKKDFRPGLRQCYSYINKCLQDAVKGEQCDIWPNLESQFLRAPHGGSSSATDGGAAAGREGRGAAAAAAAARTHRHAQARTHSVPQLIHITATGVIAVIQINGGCLIAF